MILISFAKRLEFDGRVEKVEIKSMRIARYFLEHSDKRSERINEMEKLREDIVFSDQDQNYKDDKLNRLDLTLHILRQQYNPLLIFVAGIFSGIGIKSIFDYVADWLVREGGEAYSSELQKRLYQQVHTH